MKLSVSSTTEQFTSNSGHWLVFPDSESMAWDFRKKPRERLTADSTSGFSLLPISLNTMQSYVSILKICMCHNMNDKLIILTDVSSYSHPQLERSVLTSVSISINCRQMLFVAMGSCKGWFHLRRTWHCTRIFIWIGKWMLKQHKFFITKHSLKEQTENEISWNTCILQEVL